MVYTKQEEERKERYRYRSIDDELRHLEYCQRDGERNGFNGTDYAAHPKHYKTTKKLLENAKKFRISPYPRSSTPSYLGFVTLRSVALHGAKEVYRTLSPFGKYKEPLYIKLGEEIDRLTELKTEKFGKKKFSLRGLAKIIAEDIKENYGDLVIAIFMGDLQPTYIDVFGRIEPLTVHPVSTAIHNISSRTLTRIEYNMWAEHFGLLGIVDYY